MSIIGAAGGLIGAARAQVAAFDRSRPHTAGRIRQVIGGVLIADGLVGLENPLDGTKSRPGILRAFFLVLVGAVFLVAGGYEFVTAPDPDASAQGTVVQVIEGQPDNGHVSCGLEVTFNAGGKTYRTRSAGSSTDWCGDRKGSRMLIRYERRDPTHNVVGNGPGPLPLVLAVVGALVFLFFVGLFLLRLASIGFGVWLFWKGKRLVDTHPASPGDEEVVRQAKERFTTLVRAARGRGGSLLSALTG